MGGSISKAMDDNMKKSQQDMLERQIQMNNYMREQQMAMQIARSRDLFHYWAGFYIFVVLGSVAGMRRRRPFGVVALVPFTFIVGYLGDMAYGSKMTRMRAEALRILNDEAHLLKIPSGLPTVTLLDERRKGQK